MHWRTLERTFADALGVASDCYEMFCRCLDISKTIVVFRLTFAAPMPRLIRERAMRPVDCRYDQAAPMGMKLTAGVSPFRLYDVLA